MNRAWKTVNLGDICRITSSKRIFAKEYRTSGVPFYRGKEIIEKHNGRKVSNELYISKERYEEIRNKFDVPKKGDILLSSVGTLGVAWLVDEDEFYFKDGNLTWLRCNEKMIPGFLYLWLNSPSARNQINAMCIGSTQKALTIETLKNFLVELPPIETQKRICRIIDPISNKIKTNNQINKNLLQQAGAVFDKFYEESSNQQSFTSFIRVLSGGTPKTGNSDFWNGPIPFFTPKDVGVPYTFQTEKHITESGLAHCNSRLYQKDTTFVTARGTVGKVSLAGTPMAMNQSCYALVSDVTDPLLVYFYVLKAVASLKHKASGAVFDAIVTRDFDSETINLLSDNDSKSVLSIIRPMMEAIHNNSKENIRLVALRDSLLPRLMLGELDVSKVDL